MYTTASFNLVLHKLNSWSILLEIFNWEGFNNQWGLSSDAGHFTTKPESWFHKSKFPGNCYSIESKPSPNCARILVLFIYRHDKNSLHVLVLDLPFLQREKTGAIVSSTRDATTILAVTECVSSKSYLEWIARYSISHLLECLSLHMKVIFACGIYLSDAKSLLSSSDLCFSPFRCYSKAFFMCESNGSFELHIFQSQVDVTELLIIAEQFGSSMLYISMDNEEYVWKNIFFFTVSYWHRIIFRCYRWARSGARPERVTKSIIEVLDSIQEVWKLGPSLVEFVKTLLSSTALSRKQNMIPIWCQPKPT